MIYWTILSKPYIAGLVPCYICKKEIDEVVFLYAKTETARDFLDMMFKQTHSISLCLECKDKFESECKERGISFKKLVSDEDRIGLLPDAIRHIHEVMPPSDDD